MTSVTICVEVSTEEHLAGNDREAFVEAARQHLEDELGSFEVDFTTEDFYGNETEHSLDCDGGTPWVEGPASPYDRLLDAACECFDLTAEPYDSTTLAVHETLRAVLALFGEDGRCD